MADWWKSITDKFGGKAGGTGERESPESASLRDRLAKERERLRTGGNEASDGMLARGESIADAEAQDRRVLISLLGWKLDTRFEQGKQPTTNPAKVDGYWFGVIRYRRNAQHPGEQDGIGWKLHFLRICPHCKNMIPTIELGDYAEVEQATEQMMHGQNVTLEKATGRLAAYLNDVESGRPDPYCPRQCPACRKLLRGGTL